MRQPNAAGGPIIGAGPDGIHDRMQRQTAPGLGTARALFWVQVAHLLLAIAAVALAPLLVIYAVGLFENVQTVPVVLVIVVAIAFAITIPALHLVSLVLASITAVRGSGLVRIGAIVILVALIGAVAVTFSFTSSGETGGIAESVERVAQVIGYALAALELLAQVVGVILLRIGISRARRR